MQTKLYLIKFNSHAYVIFFFLLHSISESEISIHYVCSFEASFSVDTHLYAFQLIMHVWSFLPYFKFTHIHCESSCEQGWSTSVHIKFLKFVGFFFLHLFIVPSHVLPYYCIHSARCKHMHFESISRDWTKMCIWSDEFYTSTYNCNFWMLASNFLNVIKYLAGIPHTSSLFPDDQYVVSLCKPFSII